MGIVGNNIRTNENRFLIPPIVIDMEKDEIYRSPSYFCAATSAAIGATGQRGNGATRMDPKLKEFPTIR